MTPKLVNTHYREQDEVNVQARMYNALQVMLTDEKIREYLLKNDPQAYMQAQDAVHLFLLED